jgi:hypothetical protein
MAQRGATTMPIYALIDHNSGYLFGVLDAPNPIGACQTLDREIYAGPRRYAEERIAGTTRTGYHVYDVTGIMDPDEDHDGCHPGTIALAMSGRPMAQIACYDATDD